MAEGFSMSHSQDKAPCVLPSDSLKAISSLRFSNIHEEFIAYKIKTNNLSSKMQSDYQRYYNVWKELVDDKPVGDYKSFDLKNFLRVVVTFPKKNLKRYLGCAILSGLLDLEIPKKDLISVKTASGYRKWLQILFEYCRDMKDVFSTYLAANLKFD